MLTLELLKSNPKLATLSEEQLTAITTLSKNDEDIVIGAKTREINDRFDADLKEITGLEKPGGVKTYEHLKTVLTDLKGKAEKAANVGELTKQIKTLTDEKTALEKKIADGSTDQVLKGRVATLEQALKDKESEINTVKTTYESEKEKLSTELQTLQKETVKLELNGAFDSYVVNEGLKFKSTLPEDFLKEVLTTRKNKLLSTVVPDMVDNGKGDGGKVRVFRDDKGEIIRDEKTLSPVSAGQLWGKQIADLVDGGQKRQGGGTRSGDGGGTPVNLDLSGAKSQLEANKLIVNHILKNEGLAKTDPKFAERQTAIYQENKVAELPLRSE